MKQPKTIPDMYKCICCSELMHKDDMDLSIAYECPLCSEIHELKEDALYCCQEDE